MSRKFYWLKLKRDFFKRHDIRILAGMPDGSETVLLYLKLLCEAVDHNGDLRFSETVPYDAKMLSCVTETPEEVISEALGIFQYLGLVSVLEDKTIHMNQIDSMLGYETEWAEKKRQQRDNKGTLEGQSEDNVLKMSTQCPQSVPTLSDKRLENKRIDSRDRLKEKENKEREKKDTAQALTARTSSNSVKKFSPPSLEELESYCKENKLEYVDAQKFMNYYQSNGWRVGRNPMKDWRAAARSWNRNQFQIRQIETGGKMPILENNDPIREPDDPNDILKSILGGD
jgi:predicted phage replisome organizer